MLIIGSFSACSAIGLLCWLIFTLAVYAMPFFVGLTAGLAAFHGGAGVIGALVVGLIAGVSHSSSARSRSPSFARCLFAPPSGRSSHCGGASRGFTRHSDSRRSACRRCFGARFSPGSARIIIGCTAWARLAVSQNPFRSPERSVVITEPQPRPCWRNATRG